MIKLHTAERLGPIEQTYELQTNDPKHPVIRPTVVATVRPLPAYVRRIATADVARGEGNGVFQIWPTARPTITLEAGERFNISLRLRPLIAEPGTLTLPADAPATWKLRHEATGDYWLDLPIDAGASRTVPLVVDMPGGRSREIRVQLTVNVPAENVVVTPREVDFGEVSLAKAQGSLKRIGIRKLVGSFHIKSASSTLPFLKLDQATMVEGSNYLIRVTIDPTRPLKPGSYEGLLIIETDDGHRAEVKINIKLLDRD